MIASTPVPVQKPFGTWDSPLPAAAVASQGVRLSSVSIDEGHIYWIEGRPSEGGRNVLIRRSPDGAITELTPAAFNVRTRVHEYGGGAHVVSGGVVCVSNFSDQRVYRLEGLPTGEPAAIPLTPDGDWYYADFVVDQRRRRLICVREDHTAPGGLPGGEARTAKEPVNTLVSIALDGTAPAVDVIASGYDFYSTPRLSPDGRRLSWLSWRHPQMPWDGTELWVADVTESGSLTNAIHVAGSEAESIYQPGWSPDGVLYYVSDRTGWWTIYRSDRPHDPTVIVEPPEHAEFGRPHWVFGTATWAFAGPSHIVVSYTRGGRWHLALADAATGSWRPLAAGFEPQDWLAATKDYAVLVAASATMPNAVVRVDLESESVTILADSSSSRLDPADISVAEPVEFPAGNGETAHAFYYAPRNSQYSARDGERPPVIAIGHGGPTTAATGTFDSKIQFWTTRGFAVVDVNYRGSSGYGRSYRQRLAGEWGIVDVADMVAAVGELVAQGRADAERLIIRGGSAGGYTALAALTFHPGAFKAGASYYGISDIEVLAHDTHKFESRYLDGLVGPYPEMRETYRARSPIHFVDRVSCPLILFQGLEDKVVPPNQSQMMADTLRARKLPVAYLAFEGEQHGFRRAETIVASLEAELYFYGAVFGFSPADTLQPVTIDNLPPPAD